MPTQNITVDQNQDLSIDITDTSADSETQQIGVIFYNDGAFALMLGQEALGRPVGQVVIVDDTKFTISVKKEEALLLSGVCTYEIYDYAQSPPVLLDSGDVTITPLTGTNPDKVPVQVINSIRQTKATGDYSATKDDDTIYYSTGADDTFKVALPDPEIMIGKKIKIINDGEGTVEIYQNDTTTLLLELNPPHSAYECEAIESDTDVFVWI